MILLVSTDAHAFNVRLDWTASLSGAAGDVTASGSFGVFAIDGFPGILDPPIPLLIPTGTAASTSSFAAGGLGPQDWTLDSTNLIVHASTPTSGWMATQTPPAVAEQSIPCPAGTCYLRIDGSVSPAQRVEIGVSAPTPVASSGSIQITVTILPDHPAATIQFAKLEQTADFSGYLLRCDMFSNCWLDYPLTEESITEPISDHTITTVTEDGIYTPDDFTIALDATSGSDSGFTVSALLDCSPTDTWERGGGFGPGHLECRSSLSARFTVDQPVQAHVKWDSTLPDGRFLFEDPDRDTVVVFEDPTDYSYEETVLLVPGAPYYVDFEKNVLIDEGDFYEMPPCPFPCSGSWGFSLELIQINEPPPTVPSFSPIARLVVVGLMAAVGIGAQARARRSRRGSSS